MSLTIAPVVPSGSTGGRMIKVVATSTAGTAIHATGTSATIFDEITLWAINTSTAEVKLTIEWGGVTSPDDLIEVSIPPEQGLVPVVMKGRLVGTGAAARTVGAWAASANVINILAIVNRIT